MDNPVAAWLEVQKCELVELAEKLVRETRIAAPIDEEPGARDPPPAAVTPSQIRNFLAAAQNGNPLAVLTNFLRYQRGRGRGLAAWRHEASFRQLENLFTADFPERCRKISGPLTTEQKLDAEARLAAQFLGFLLRDYTYRRHLYEEAWSRNHPDSPRRRS